jgi:hypothetical protein
MAHRIGEESEDIFHVPVLLGFELGVEFGMEVVPGYE